MRITEDQHQDLLKRLDKPTSSAPSVKRTRPPKYGSKKTLFDGETFDSKKEAVRYQYLKYRQSVGEISELARQVVFSIDVNGHHICNYIADAVYMEGGAKVVEDTKSAATRKLPAYRLKRRLMKAAHGIEIKET